MHTSSEAGAWSNSYLIYGERDAILFDVFMLRADAAGLVAAIMAAGKSPKAVVISHAHPDHFMGLEVILAAFPGVPVLSTPNVIADLQADGPWMFSLLQSKLGANGPTRLIVPEALPSNVIRLQGVDLEVMEFGECESKHIACIHCPSERWLLSSDLIYHNAHCYLQEKHLTGWLQRLDELERFVSSRGIVIVHPGHGPSGDARKLIDHTRQYLRDFADALKASDPAALEKALLDKYPAHHAKQFLTMFSVPAYFPPGAER